MSPDEESQVPSLGCSNGWGGGGVWGGINHGNQYLEVNPSHKVAISMTFAMEGTLTGK